MTNRKRTWLLIGASILVALAAELVTISWGYPMSHAAHDAPPIVIALFAFAVGVLFGHFWWPAKSRWKRLEALVREFGPPQPGDSWRRLRAYAAELWDAYQGERGEKQNGPSGPRRARLREVP